MSEGERYRVGTVDYEGQEVIKPEALNEIFSEVRPGEYYSEEDVRTGFDIAKELYGSVGYYEMTAFPDYAFRTDPQPDGLPTRIEGDPIVDVTLHFQEGEQYFINRIKFVGNNSTHDEVIRREINMVERGVFTHRGAQIQRPSAQSVGVFRAARRRERHPNRQATRLRE